MYRKFRLLDSAHIAENYSIYGNGDLMVFANFITDTVKIALAYNFDRWSNSVIKETQIPYTKEDYVKFEKIICGLSPKVNMKNHARLIFS